MDGEQNLASLGIVTFVAALQFLPGLFGAFFWRGASKIGFLCGLVAGFTVWFAMLMLPLTIDIYSSLQLSDIPFYTYLPSINWHMTVEPVMVRGDNGMEESGEYKFDSSGANRSLELIGKHFKLFTDKIDHSSSDGSMSPDGLTPGERQARIQALLAKAK